MREEDFPCAVCGRLFTREELDLIRRIILSDPQATRLQISREVCTALSWLIGWSGFQREKNLHLIVNNSRFLILPWVQVKNLASKVLSLAVQKLPENWEKTYGYRPALLETFVEKNRFAGTCYKAANWIFVGSTQGRGKLDRFNEYKLPVKDIYLYPLVKNFRAVLLGLFPQ